MDLDTKWKSVRASRWFKALCVVLSMVLAFSSVALLSAVMRVSGLYNDDAFTDPSVAKKGSLVQTTIFKAELDVIVNEIALLAGQKQLQQKAAALKKAKADSVARRSCQTALFHIVEALVRWMAPIMSFTADEIWGYLPGEREKYVFTGEWYEGLFGLADDEAMNDDFWDELLKVRGEVNKVIEQARADKKVGGSLEAAVTLYADADLAAKLNALGDELRFVLLTSGANVADYASASADAQQSELLKGLKVALSKAEGEKCPRCWHYTTDIGKVAEHAEICGRCVSNVAGDGEQRKFA